MFSTVPRTWFTAPVLYFILVLLLCISNLLTRMLTIPQKLLQDKNHVLLIVVLPRTLDSNINIQDVLKG